MKIVLFLHVAGMSAYIDTSEFLLSWILSRDTV
jgi:hypothetical protein